MYMVAGVQPYSCLPYSIALFYLKICQLLKHFSDTNYSKVSVGLQPLKPLFPNEILLFINPAKQRRKKKKETATKHP